MHRYDVGDGGDGDDDDNGDDDNQLIYIYRKLNSTSHDRIPEISTAFCFGRFRRIPICRRDH